MAAQMAVQWGMKMVGQKGSTSVDLLVKKWVALWEHTLAKLTD